MQSINSLVGSNVQLKYQHNLKTQQAEATDIAKPASKPVAVASVDAAKPVATPSTPAVNAFSIPKVDSASLFAGTITDIFNNFDSDKNGLVTKDEIVNILKSAGADDKGIEAFVNNVLSETSDTNGDGLSMVELNRRLKADAGDAFAAYDLNSDGQIGSDELEEAITRFTAAGWKIDPDNVRKIYSEMNIDDDKTLTRLEFDNFNKYGRPTEETRGFEVIFNQFDANGDGRVTRDEALSILKAQGADDKSAEAFLANVFSSDLDGDNAITIPELRARIYSDTGKVFERLDTNFNREITKDEVEEVIAQYVKNGRKIDPDALRKFFNDADANKDGILTSNEFATFNSKPSDATVAKPAAQEPVNVADNATAKPVPIADVIAVDTVSFKPQIPKIAPAAIDAQLFLLLQEVKA